MRIRQRTLDERAPEALMLWPGPFPMFPSGVADQSRVRIRAPVSPPPKAQTRRLEAVSLAMFLRTKRERRTLPVLTGRIDMDGTGRLQPAAPR